MISYLSRCGWQAPLVVIETVIGLTCLAGCDNSTGNKGPRSPSAAVDSVVSKAGDLVSPNASDIWDAPESNAFDPKARFPRFRDVAFERGVDFKYFNDAVPNRLFLPEVMGAGIAWIDYDLDGSLDLYLVNGCPLATLGDGQTEHISRLYRQHLGENRFVDATSVSGCWHNGYGQGCAVGDYDGDGFPDLFLSNYGADVLLHNLGDGSFEVVTATARTTDDDWSSSAVWHDVDGDGNLDLYVVNYMDVHFANHRICYYDKKPGYCGPGDYQGVTDSVYLNLGDGRFREAGASLGLNSAEGKGLAVSVVDFDGDQECEIYVANDMDANFLFSTRAGDGGKRYGEMAVVAGCATSGEGLNEASMGIAIADFDGDGRSDIYLTNFYHAKSTLYQNLGDLTFGDDSYRSRAAFNSHDSLGFGTASLDWDRDGAPDLLVANGHVFGPHVEPWQMRQQALWNNGVGRFYDVSDQAGPYFQEMAVGRCLASADFDNDGDIDVAFSHLDRPMAILLNETDPGGHFLGLDLRTPNRLPALGAQATIEIPGRAPIVLLTQAGGSYLAAPDTRLLCGWLEDVNEVALKVIWPDGSVERYESLAADRYWIIRPGLPPRQASQ